MKNDHSSLLKSDNSRGGVLVLVALLMSLLVGIAAFAIDIGYIATTKNELQNIADSAALAATGKLGDLYLISGGTYDSSTAGDIEDVAIDVGVKNKAGGKASISVARSDIEIGKWTGTAFTESGTAPLPDAVKVTVHRKDGLNDKISAFFASVIGFDSFAVSADAVAALTGQLPLGDGEAKLPVGVSERWFDPIDENQDGLPDGCQQNIHFEATGTSCAGWHTYTQSNASTSVQRDNMFGTILEYTQPGETPNLDFLTDEELQWLQDNYPLDLTNEGMSWLLVRYRDNPSMLNYLSPANPNNDVLPYVTPGVNDGSGVTHFEFTGGVVGAVMGEDDSMTALFDFFKVRDDDDRKLRDDDGNLILDADGNPQDTWATTVPVYKDNDTCANPTQSTLIVGATDVLLKKVNPSPDNSLDIETQCVFKPFRGGGGISGNMGIIPNLVE